MQIGLREANQQFSRLMKALRAGREVLLTERGRPLAVVRPIRTGDGGPGRSRGFRCRTPFAMKETSDNGGAVGLLRYQRVG